MGPQTNNLSGNFNNAILSGEQLGLPPSPTSLSSQIQVKKKNLIFIIPVILLILVVLFFVFLQATQKGSGSKEDLVRFMKLYQYGNETDKKDVNLNLPANYTFAYELATGTESATNQSTYANNLYSSYLKYSNDKRLSEYLFLYKTLVQLAMQIPILKQNYIEHGEESAKKLVLQYIKDYKTITNETIKKKLVTVEEYFNNYLEYFHQIEQAGCISSNQLNEDCEMQLKNNSSTHPEFDTISQKITSTEAILSSQYQYLCVDINNIATYFYKEKINRESRR